MASGGERRAVARGGDAAAGRVSEVHHALKGGLVADALNLVDPGGDAGPRIEEGETEVQAERRRARSGRFEPL